MLLFKLLSVALMGVLADMPGKQADDLESPVRIQAGDRTLDIGHSANAAPCFFDFDGDGLPDLLVGEGEEGRLRIYKNVGSAGSPRFADFTWFKAGTDLGRVPFG